MGVLEKASSVVDCATEAGADCQQPAHQAAHLRDTVCGLEVCDLGLGLVLSGTNNW